MKNILTKSALGALALGLIATTAQADWDRDGYGYGHGYKQAYQHDRAYGQQINARQDRQMERIEAGMRSGELTRSEFRELMREQHDIRAMEQRFRADGRINTREFQRLDRELDQANRNIKQERHDRQARQAYGYDHRFN